MPELRTETLDEPAAQGSAPAEYWTADRRIFGLAPQALIATLAGILLLVSALLLVSGHVVAGLLALAFGLLLGAMYVEGARGRRRTAADRLTAAAFDNSRALAGFATSSLRAWTSAGRRVTQLRFESRGLARTRTRLIADLGAATYDCEENRAAELLTDLRALDGRREACDAEIRATLEAARARSAEERLAVGATEIRRPDET